MSKSSNLPAIAKKTPGCREEGKSWSKPESRVKWFSRWMGNDFVQTETFFLPFARALLQALSHAPLFLTIDGSVVGRGCMMLMMAVVYKKRALPIAWTVAKKRKGHFPEIDHIELICKVERLIPDGPQVMLLGDGEFDGVDLQALINHWKWKYVLRTGENITVSRDGTTVCYEDLGAHVGIGEYFCVHDAFFSNREYGPILAVTAWREDCKEPIHLVTNLKDPAEAIRLYGKRFKIETFFSDQKSRGFHIHKSHLSDPQRLSRLLIAACLAYLWMVYLGAYAVESGAHRIIHRTKRCDLSLFQLGLSILEYLLDINTAIPVAFYMSD
jgi:hypothetical protein